MEIFRISPREAIANWKFYEEKVKKVLRRVDAGLSTEDVLSAVQTGDMQLWRDESFKAMGVTEIQKYRQFSVLLIFMVAGCDLNAWVAAAQAKIEDFARHEGCKYVEFIGRPAWERLLAKYGYTDKFIRMRKEL